MMSGSVEQTTIGFIGSGVMGKSMAGHLLRAGYALNIYTRTAAKAEALIEQGAIWQDSPAALAAASDVVITMVGEPHDVSSLYLGEHGLIAHARKDALLIDMTTSSPALAVQLAERGKQGGLPILDAPVSGGDIGAREAKLSIMAGGDADAYERALPIFRLLGTTIARLGEAGAGQHTKMCNQIAIASNMLGVCEALAYAGQAGLQPEQVLGSISTGAAGSWSLSQLGPRMINGDYEPGFYIKHFIKDMRIALESAKELGLDTPGLKLASTLYQQLAEQGYADKGTQALHLHYVTSA